MSAPTSRLATLVFAVVGYFLYGCHDRLALDRIQKELTRAVMTARSGVVTIEVEPNRERGENVDWNDRFGAGVVMDSDGTIVTTQSVIEGGRSFAVLFQDGCRLSAELLGYDRETNLALLRTATHSHGCYPVPLSDGEQPDVGAIGLIVGHTMLSRGVAAGWGVMATSWLGGDDFWNDPLYLIQTGDLPARAGSGVVDIHGRLIGICDNRIAGYKGAWTVIPVTTIRRIATVLKEEGSVQRGWIGLYCNCRNGVAAVRTTGERGGVEVLEVVPESPAARAGIQSGNHILAVDDVQIEGVVQLRRYLTGTKPGQYVELELVSADDKIRNLMVEVGRLADDPERPRRCNSRSL